ncbi:DNA methylase [Collinsella intestinalis]|nr:DNA methylase [Collinsella intestinalis]
MEKVELRTADIAAENAAKLAELFPDIVTEVLDEDGNVRHSIDVEALKAHVGDIADDERERYQFTWPGKQKARAEAIRAIDKTMRPCPEESVNWDTTENLYIEGDNLDALKILRETYAGKIKMIYIDPPYNTGHDFVYNDDFARSVEEERAESGAFDEEGNVLDAAYKVNNESNGKFHSDWCSMMYPRLVLAWDLLSNDGLMLVSLDNTEHANLKKLCDALFGAAAYVTDFVWIKKDKASGVPPVNMVLPNYEHVIAYSKDERFAFRGQSRSMKSYKQDADGRWWRTMPIQATGAQDNWFEIVDPLSGRRKYGNWAFSEESIKKMQSEGRILFPVKEDGLPVQIVYADEMKNQYSCLFANLGKFDSESSTKQFVRLFDGKKVFDYSKPIGLLEFLTEQVSGREGTVLDFFSGSATTAHAVMQLNAEDGGNRKFIMVQLPEVCDEKSEAAKAGYKNICEIGKERIRRAGAKIAAEVEEANAQLKLGEEPKRVPDIGFRVLKIDSSNFEDVQRTPDTLFQDALFSLADNIKPGRTPEDILFQLFPKLEIPYTARIDTFDICGKTVYSVDDDTLVACFDREVPEDVVRAMAEREPAWAVLRDASFTGDDALANFEEIFKTVSPETKTRVV